MNESVDAVLAAAIWHDPIARQVVTDLPESVIDGAQRQRVLDALTSLMDAGATVDPFVVMARIRDQRQPGWDAALRHLNELVTLPSAPVTVGWHLSRLRQEAARTALRVVGAQVSQLADDADPFEASLVARDRLERVDLGSGSAPPSMADRLGAWLDALEAGDTTRTLPTGFRDVDALLSGGLRPGQLVVVGARPGVGKSILLGDLARAAVGRGARVLWHSLEMPVSEVQDRMGAAICRVPLDRLGSRSRDVWDRVESRTSDLALPTLHVEDRPSVTVGDVHRTARAVRPDLLLIDYLQLIQPAKASGNRQEDVAGISRALKLLARDLRCPVVVAAQLNRALTSRSDTKPRLSDLRESGAIEADADVVLLLDRDPDDETQGTTAEVLVAKNRGGPTGTVSLAFMGHYASFGSLWRTAS